MTFDIQDTLEEYDFDDHLTFHAEQSEKNSIENENFTL